MISDRQNFINNLSDKLAGKVIWLDNSKYIYSLLEKTVKPLIIAMYDENKDISFIDDPEDYDLDIIIGWFSKNAKQNNIYKNDTHPALKIKTFSELVETSRSKGGEDNIISNKYSYLSEYEIFVTEMDNGHYLIKLDHENALKNDYNPWGKYNFSLIDEENPYPSSPKQFFSIKNTEHQDVCLFYFLETTQDNKKQLIVRSSKEIPKTHVSQEYWNRIFKYFREEMKYDFSGASTSPYFPYVVESDGTPHHISNLPEKLNIKFLHINGYNTPLFSNIKFPKEIPNTRWLTLKNVKVDTIPSIMESIVDITLANSHIENMIESIILPSENDEKTSYTNISLINVTFGNKGLKTVTAHNVHIDNMNSAYMPTSISASNINISDNLSNTPISIRAKELMIQNYSPKAEYKETKHNINAQQVRIVNDYYHRNNAIFDIPYGITTNILELKVTYYRDELLEFDFTKSKPEIKDRLVIPYSSNKLQSLKGINFGPKAIIERKDKIYGIKEFKFKNLIKAFFTF